MVDAKQSASPVLLPEIQQEYERWQKKIGTQDPYQSPKTVGLRDVLWAHFLLIDYFTRKGEGYGGVGPRDLNLLHSALHRQFVGYGHLLKWREDLDRCATLFYGLIMDHPFHDCNKRTAFLVLLYHLFLIGRCTDIRQKEFENLAVKTADHKLDEYSAYARFKGTRDADVLLISDFLRRGTRRIDKRYYAVTFNDLNTILGRFGCRLDNPHKNRIDVVRVTRRRHWLTRKDQEVVQRVCQIGFPGWKRMVGQGAINTVRHATDLTPERGCDSLVFFRGFDPMSELVKEYENPLRRLADR
jgi:death-on-curing protein